LNEQERAVNAATRQEFQSFRDNYERNMEKMFAAISDLYAKYWNDLLHFAQFEGEDQTWEDAFSRTHAKYMEALRVRDAARIADLACGRGGFAGLMADNTAGQVLGVDISHAQLSYARKHKRPNLKFRRHDIMKIDELGESFDAVSFMDAACYLPDKLLGMQKIRKILNPGARFLFIDWCKREGLSRHQEEVVLHPFMRYWNLPSLETRERYERCFRKNGFDILDVQDLNACTRRNWDFGYEAAIKAAAELSIKDVPKLLWTGIKSGPEAIRLIKEEFPAALYIKAGFDAGFLRYTYFLLERS
jgi:SAM-dependent methyltransferase